MASSQFFPKPPATVEVKSDIIESNDIADVLKYYARDRYLVLDLDNTVIEPEDEHEELGSDQWFVRFLGYAKDLNLGENNIHAATFVIAIYHAVQHHVQLKLIQPEIVDIIKVYLSCGNPVLFLTARGPEICEPTLRQLKRNGIDLSDQWGEDKCLLTIGDGDKLHPPIFKSGGIFCGGKPKEKCLQAFVELLGNKPDVIMADDKAKYLEAVIKMVREHGGHAIGLRYGRLDEKVKLHDFEKAQEKLQEMSPKLSPDAQQAMASLGFKL